MNKSKKANFGLYEIKTFSPYLVLYCQHLAQCFTTKKDFWYKIRLDGWMNGCFPNQVVLYWPQLMYSQSLGCLWRKMSAVCFPIIFLCESKSLLNFRRLQGLWNSLLLFVRREERTIFFPTFLAYKEKQISEKHGTEQEVLRGLVILVRYEKAPLHSHIVSFMDLTLPTLRIPSSPRVQSPL